MKIIDDNSSDCCISHATTVFGLHPGATNDESYCQRQPQGRLLPDRKVIASTEDILAMMKHWDA